MPTLQQLRYLVAVADYLNFRRAAEQCFVTQPTLSAQIKELEHRLGDVVLIERSRSVVVMTDLGKAVAVRARNILREADEIRALCKIDEGMLSGTLRVGVVHSLGSYLLPQIIPDLRISHPNLRLYAREALAEQLLDQLEFGRLDLLFFPLPHRRAQLSELPLFREPLYVVVPESHPMAQRDCVGSDDLFGETVLSLESGHRLYDQIKRICDEFGAHLSHDYEGTSLDTIRHMVAMGMGISLMPALYVQSEVVRQADVCALPLVGLTPNRTVGMVWRRSTVRGGDFIMLGRSIQQILARCAPNLIILDPPDDTIVSHLAPASDQATMAP